MSMDKMPKEEQKAHDAAVAARREQKRVEAEQAKAKQDAERKAERERVVLMASSWANATSMTDGKPGCGNAKDKVTRVMNRIGEQWQENDKRVQQFAEDLRISPFHAFTWANEAITAAARCDIMVRIMNSVTIHNKGLLEVLSNVRGDMMDALLNDFDAPTSTSPAHNAAMIALRSVRCNHVSGSWDGVSAWENYLKAE